MHHTYWWSSFPNPVEKTTNHPPPKTLPLWEFDDLYSANWVCQKWTQFSHPYEHLAVLFNIFPHSESWVPTNKTYFCELVNVHFPIDSKNLQKTKVPLSIYKYLSVSNKHLEVSILHQYLKVPILSISQILSDSNPNRRRLPPRRRNLSLQPPQLLLQLPGFELLAMASWGILLGDYYGVYPIFGLKMKNII